MYNGFLVINKEPGSTSHQVVAELRRLLGQRRIGHTGTLDPMARGVLVTALGTATKLISYLNEERKVYQARLVLGVTTDTQDITGRVLARDPETRITREELAAVLKEQLGRQEQIPPMFSAVKINGEPLYKLARRGQTVARKKRPVHIYRLEICGQPQAVYKYGEGPELLIECSKGTYIRTLCHDIGRALGCGGCLGELERTASGPFTLADAWSLPEISSALREGRLEEKIIPSLQALSHMPCLTLNPEAAARVAHGNFIPAAEEGAEAALGVTAGQEIVAVLKLVQRGGKRFWQPVKVLKQAGAFGKKGEKR